MGKSFLAPFIILPGQAEEAMAFYVRVIPESKQRMIDYYQDSILGEQGKVIHGEIEIWGQNLLFMDMKPGQAPVASWNVTLHLEFETENLFDDVFHGLKEGGQVLMGPEPIFNIRKVAWITDKFGITWELVWV